MAKANSISIRSALASLDQANDTLNYSQAVLDGIETLGQRILGECADDDKETTASAIAVSSMSLDAAAKLSAALDAIAAAREMIEGCAEVVHG